MAASGAVFRAWSAPRSRPGHLELVSADPVELASARVPRCEPGGNLARRHRLADQEALRAVASHAAELTPGLLRLDSFRHDLEVHLPGQLDG